MSAISNEAREDLRQAALLAGFDLAGFTSAEIPRADRENLDRFVNEGRHTSMSWFADTLEMRKNPEMLLPGAKSALVLATLYRDGAAEPLYRDGERKLKIARYALGKDYHKHLRKKAERLIGTWLKETGNESVKYRVVTDSAPVAEKVLAKQSGIGWQGKNTNLIHPQKGSYFFLTVVLFDQSIEPDSPMTDHCATCSKCIDACPTGALQPYKIDAEKCISYRTIESKELRSDRLAKNPAAENEESLSWIFGCDICQEVCPYNNEFRGGKVAAEDKAFKLRPETDLLWQTLNRYVNGEIQHEDLSKEVCKELMKGTALKRAGFERIIDSVSLAKKFQG